MLYNNVKQENYLQWEAMLGKQIVIWINILAIGFGLVVGALGSCLGRYVGGVVGGIIYQYDSLNNSIQNEINRAQPYMQNFNYDGLMMPH